MRTLIPLLLLTACTAPNHLGNPLTLPISGIATAVENASYNSRRTQVSTFLTSNEQAIQSEARTTPGPALAALYQTARIPPQNQPAVRRDLAEISGPTPPDYWYLPQWPPTDWVERATVIVMVHSG